MRTVDRGALIRFVAVAVTTLAAATIAVWVLQDVLGVPNPSAVYLVAVVATAIVSGTVGAIATAVASFVLYNFLFTEPRYTLSMHEPGVWLSVVLLLFVGIVVGQLAALQRSRAEVATQREHEARALFAVSRALATRESIDAVLGQIAAALQGDAHLSKVIIRVGSADLSGSPFEGHGVLNQLRRMPNDIPAEWVRVHQPQPRGRSQPEGASEADIYRVAIESGGDAIGSIWAARDRISGRPSTQDTLLLSAAADQLGQAIAHDRLAGEAHAAEVARESDALKSALLQSVSHDLRTPLATIRAAAGTLRANASLDSDVARESVDAIEREVEYLNRLVSNLLDLSRIEAGVLRASIDTFELDDLVSATLERLGSRLDGWTIDNRVGPQPVEADPVFFDATLTNVIENALRHTPPGTTIRISSANARRPADVGSPVTLTVEDSGEGVPDEAIERLFEKFYRVPLRRSSRSGTGIGLSVARGLIESMGGQIDARRSTLGGLAIDIELRPARIPAELASAGAASGVG